MENLIFEDHRIWNHLLKKQIKSHRKTADFEKKKKKKPWNACPIQ
jgi:hypothetical protein